MLYLHGNQLSDSADLSPLARLPHLRRVTLFNNPMCFKPYKQRVQRLMADTFASSAVGATSSEKRVLAETSLRSVQAQWPLQRIPVPGTQPQMHEGQPMAGTTISFQLPRPLPAVAVQDAVRYRQATLHHLPSSVICIDNHLVAPAERPVAHLMSAMASEAAIGTSLPSLPALGGAQGSTQRGRSLIDVVHSSAAQAASDDRQPLTQAVRGSLEGYGLQPLTAELGVPPPQFDAGAPFSAHISVTVLEVQWLCERYCRVVDDSGLPPNVELLQHPTQVFSEHELAAKYDRKLEEVADSEEAVSQQCDSTVGSQAEQEILQQGTAFIAAAQSSAALASKAGLAGKAANRHLPAGRLLPSWWLAHAPAIVALQRGIRRFIWRAQKRHAVEAWLRESGMSELAEGTTEKRVSTGVVLFQQLFRLRRGEQHRFNAATRIQKAVRGHLARLSSMAMWVARHSRAQAMLTPTCQLAIPRGGDVRVPRAVMEALQWSREQHRHTAAYSRHSTSFLGPSIPALGCADAGLSIMVPRGMATPLRSRAEKALAATISGTIAASFAHRASAALESLCHVLVSVRLCVLWGRHGGFIGVTGAVSRAHKWLLHAANSALTAAEQQTRTERRAQAMERAASQAAMPRTDARLGLQSARRTGSTSSIGSSHLSATRHSLKRGTFKRGVGFAGGHSSTRPSLQAPNSPGSDEYDYGLEADAATELHNVTSSVVLHQHLSDVGRWLPYVVHFSHSMRGDAGAASGPDVAAGKRSMRWERSKVLSSITPFSFRGAADVTPATHASTQAGPGGASGGSGTMPFPWLLHPREQRRLVRQRHRLQHPTLYVPVAKLATVGPAALAAATARKRHMQQTQQRDSSQVGSGHVSGGVMAPGAPPSLTALPLEQMHESTPLVYWSDSEEEEDLLQGSTHSHGTGPEGKAQDDFSGVHPSLRASLLLDRRMKELTTTVLQAYVQWWISSGYRQPKSRTFETPEAPNDPVATLDSKNAFWSLGRPTSAAVMKRQRRLSAVRVAHISRTFSPTSSGTAAGRIASPTTLRPPGSPSAGAHALSPATAGRFGTTGSNWSQGDDTTRSRARSVSPGTRARPTTPGSPTGRRERSSSLITRKHPGPLAVEHSSHTPLAASAVKSPDGRLGAPSSTSDRKGSVASRPTGALTSSTGQTLYPWPVHHRALLRSIKIAQRQITRIAAQHSSTTSIWQAGGTPFVDVTQRGAASVPSPTGLPLSSSVESSGGASGFPAESPGAQIQRIVRATNPWMLRHCVAAPLVPHSAAFSILRKQATAIAQRAAALHRLETEELVAQALQYVAITGQVPPSSLFAPARVPHGTTPGQPDSPRSAVHGLNGPASPRSTTVASANTALTVVAEVPDVRAVMGIVSHKTAFRMSLASKIAAMLPPGTPAPAVLRPGGGGVVTGSPGEASMPMSPWQVLAPVTPLAGNLLVKQARRAASLKSSPEHAAGTPAPHVGWHIAPMCAKERQSRSRAPASSASTAAAWASDVGAAHSTALRLAGYWYGGRGHLHTPSAYFAMLPPEDTSVPLPHGGLSRTAPLLQGTRPSGKHQESSGSIPPAAIIAVAARTARQVIESLPKGRSFSRGSSHTSTETKQGPAAQESSTFLTETLPAGSCSTDLVALTALLDACVPIAVGKPDTSQAALGSTLDLPILNDFLPQAAGSSSSDSLPSGSTDSTATMSSSGSAAALHPADEFTVAVAAVATTGMYVEEVLQWHLPAEVLQGDTMNSVVPTLANGDFGAAAMAAQLGTYTNEAAENRPKASLCGHDSVYIGSPGHALPVEMLAPDVAMLGALWRQLLATADDTHTVSQWLHHQARSVPFGSAVHGQDATDSTEVPHAGQSVAAGQERLRELASAAVLSNVRPSPIRLLHIVQSPLLPFTMGVLSREASLSWLHKKLQASAREQPSAHVEAKSDKDILAAIVNILTHYRNHRLLKAHLNDTSGRPLPPADAIRSIVSRGGTPGTTSAAAGQLIPAKVKIDEYLPSAPLVRALGILTGFAGPIEDISVTAGMGAVLVDAARTNKRPSATTAHTTIRSILTSSVANGSLPARSANESLSTSILRSRQPSILATAKATARAKGEDTNAPGVWDDEFDADAHLTYLAATTGLSVVLQGTTGGGSLAHAARVGEAVAIPPVALPMLGVKLLQSISAACGVVLQRSSSMLRRQARKRSKRIRSAVRTHGAREMLTLHNLAQAVRHQPGNVRSLPGDLLAILRLVGENATASSIGTEGRWLAQALASTHVRGKYEIQGSGFTQDGMPLAKVVSFMALFGGIARVQASLGRIAPRIPLGIKQLMATSWLPDQRRGALLRESRAKQMVLLRTWEEQEAATGLATGDGDGGAESKAYELGLRTATSFRRDRLLRQWGEGLKKRFPGFKQPHQSIPPETHTYETYTAMSPRDLARVLLRMRPWTASLRAAVTQEVVPNAMEAVEDVQPRPEVLGGASLQLSADEGDGSQSVSSALLGGGSVFTELSVNTSGTRGTVLERQHLGASASGVNLHKSAVQVAAEAVEDALHEVEATRRAAGLSGFVVHSCLGVLSASTSRAWQHEQDVTKIAHTKKQLGDDSDSEGFEADGGKAGSMSPSVNRARRKQALAEGALGVDIVPGLGHSASSRSLKSVSSSRSLLSIASAGSIAATRNTLHPILPPCTLMPVWAVDATAAATSIQAAWRAHRCRMQLSPPAPVQVLRNRAATAIQRAFRSRRFHRRMSLVSGIGAAARRITACNCRTLFIEADVVAALAYGGVGCVGAGDGLYGWSKPRHDSESARRQVIERTERRAKEMAQTHATATKSLVAALADAHASSQGPIGASKPPSGLKPQRPSAAKPSSVGRPKPLLHVQGTRRFGSEHPYRSAAQLQADLEKLQLTPQQRMLESHVHDWMDLRVVRPWMRAPMPEHEIVVHMERRRLQLQRLAKRLRSLENSTETAAMGGAPEDLLSIANVRPHAPPHNWTGLRVGLPLWLQLYTARTPADHGSTFAVASLKEALPEFFEGRDEDAHRMDAETMRLSSATNGVPWISEHALVMAFASPRPSAARYLGHVQPRIHPLAASVPLVSAGTKVSLVQYPGALQWSVAWATRAAEGDGRGSPGLLEDFAADAPTVNVDALHWQSRSQRLFAVQFPTVQEARLRAAMLTLLTWHAPSGTAARFLTPAELMRDQLLVPTKWAALFGRATQRNKVARSDEEQIAMKRPTDEHGFYSGNNDVTQQHTGESLEGAANSALGLLQAGSTGATEHALVHTTAPFRPPIVPPLPLPSLGADLTAYSEHAADPRLRSAPFDSYPFAASDRSPLLHQSLSDRHRPSATHTGRAPLEADAAGRTHRAIRVAAESAQAAVRDTLSARSLQGGAVAGIQKHDAARSPPPGAWTDTVTGGSTIASLGESLGASAALSGVPGGSRSQRTAATRTRWETAAVGRPRADRSALAVAAINSMDKTFYRAYATRSAASQQAERVLHANQKYPALNAMSESATTGRLLSQVGPSSARTLPARSSHSGSSLRFGGGGAESARGSSASGIGSPHTRRPGAHSTRSACIDTHGPMPPFEPMQAFPQLYSELDMGALQAELAAQQAQSQRDSILQRNAARRARHASKLAARQGVLAFTAGVSAIQRHHRHVSAAQLREERLTAAQHRAAFVRAESNAGRAVAQVKHRELLKERLFGADLRADIASLEDTGLTAAQAPKGIIYNAEPGLNQHK